ncbi:MAG: alpha/beta hydrolase [Opitutus sp.]|nr:alpha/beta hydrolase [Opitutus sp.]
MLRRVITFASLALLFCGSAKAAAAAVTLPAPRTLTYKTIGQLEIKADVFEPAAPGSRAVVVYLHGGSLINGRRDAVQNWAPAQDLIAAGVVVVSIDYRLAPETKLAGIVADLEDAFRWVREKRPALFGADPERVAVAGGSAGGYLSLVAGYRLRPRPRAVFGEMSYGDLIAPWLLRPSIHPPHYADNKLREAEAWRQVSGPPIANARDRQGDGSAFNDFIRRTAGWPKAISGWDPVTEAAKFAPYLPVRHVTAEYPPTFLIHGRLDTDVPFEQPQRMAAEFARLGIEHHLVGSPAPSTASAARIPLNSRRRAVRPSPFCSGISPPGNSPAEIPQLPS